MNRRRVLVLVVLIAAAGISACATPESAAPSCTGDQRTATVAQAVPTAAFVVCIAPLPTGWSVERFQVQRGSAAFTLASDREPRPIEVRFGERCALTGASPVAPRDDGVRTYLRVGGISPRYTGTFYDVFPGGCVTYEFDFARGPHIVLTDELRSAVDLYPRWQLERELEEDLGVHLDG